MSLKPGHAVAFFVFGSALTWVALGGGGGHGINLRFWESQCERLDRRCANGVQGGSINAYLVCGFGNLFAGAQRDEDTCRRMNLALDDPKNWQSPDHSGEARPNGPVPVRLERVTGEWFTGLSGNRHLRLRGSFWNDSDETLVSIGCDSRVEVSFMDDHPAQEARWSAACGDADGLQKGASRRFADTYGTAVNAAWLDYPISTVRLRLRLTARTAFDQRFEGEVLDVQVPPPLTKEPFELVR